MKFRIILLMLISLMYACGGLTIVGKDKTAIGLSDGTGRLNAKTNCNFKCTREREPICASGGQGRIDYLMFDNFCEFKLFNCQSETEFRAVEMEMCSKFHPDAPEYVALKEA